MTSQFNNPNLNISNDVTKSIDTTKYICPLAIDSGTAKKFEKNYIKEKLKNDQTKDSEEKRKQFARNKKTACLGEWRTEGCSLQFGRHLHQPIMKPDQRLFPIICELAIHCNQGWTIDNLKEILKSEKFFPESIMKNFKQNIRGIFCKLFNSQNGDNVIEKFFPQEKDENLKKVLLDVNKLKKENYHLWSKDRKEILMLSKIERQQIIRQLSHNGRIMKQMTTNLFSKTYTTTETENIYQGLLANAKIALELCNSMEALSESVTELRIRKFLEKYIKTTREGGKEEHRKEIGKTILEYFYLERFFLREKSDSKNTLAVTEKLRQEFQMLKTEIENLVNDIEDMGENEPTINLFHQEIEKNNSENISAISSDFSEGSEGNERREENERREQKDVEDQENNWRFENPCEIENEEMQSSLCARQNDLENESDSQSKADFEINSLKIEIKKMILITQERKSVKVLQNNEELKKMELKIYKPTKQIRIEFEKNLQNETEIKKMKYAQNINIDEIDFVSIVGETDLENFKSKNESLNFIQIENSIYFCFEVLDRQSVKLRLGRKQIDTDDPTNESILTNSTTYLIEIESKWKQELKWRISTKTTLFTNDGMFLYKFNINKKNERQRQLIYIKYPCIDPHKQENVYKMHEEILKMLLGSKILNI